MQIQFLSSYLAFWYL